MRKWWIPAVAVVLLVLTLYFFSGDMFSVLGGTDGFLSYGESSTGITAQKCWNSGDTDSSKYSINILTFCDSKYWTSIVTTQNSWSGSGSTGTAKQTLSGADNALTVSSAMVTSSHAGSVVTTKQDMRNKHFRFDLSEATNVASGQTTNIKSGYDVSLVQTSPYDQFTPMSLAALNISGYSTTKKAVCTTPVVPCDKDSYIGSGSCTNRVSGTDVNGCPTITYTYSSTTSGKCASGSGCTSKYLGYQRYQCSCAIPRTVGGTSGFVDVPVAGQTIEGVVDAPALSSSATFKNAGLIELKSAVLTPGEFDLFYGGSFVKKLTFDASKPVYVRISFGVTNEYNSRSAVLTASGIRYQYLFNCKMGANDMLAAQTFGPGQNINVSNLRYPPKSFCTENPAVVTSDTGSTTDKDIYQILASEKSYKVPADQTWTVFYIVDNTAGIIPTTCGLERAYNVNSGNCINLPGIVTVCQTGVFDPARGTCTVAPSVVCPDGASYNPDNNKCEIHLNATPTCPQGTTLVNDSCTFTPGVNASCASGTYDAALNKCVITPEVITSCPSGTVKNGSICVSTPQTETLCEEGRFDMAHNICVYNPPIQQVCERGTLNSATGQCELEYIVDSKCSNPNAVWDNQAQACLIPSPVISPDTPVINEGFASGAVDFVRTQSWWPLLLMAFCLALLTVIFTQTGEKAVDKATSPIIAFAYRNMEGFILGGLVGAIATYAWLNQFPIVWILASPFALFLGGYYVGILAYIITILFYAFIGAYIDHKWKPLS